MDSQTVTASMNCIAPLTGIPSIDNIIRAYAPSIFTESEIEIRHIAEMIEQYLFRAGCITPVIERYFEQEELIEFMQGIQIICKQEKINSITELRRFIERDIENFQPAIVCGID